MPVSTARVGVHTSAPAAALRAPPPPHRRTLHGAVRAARSAVKVMAGGVPVTFQVRLGASPS